MKKIQMVDLQGQYQQIKETVNTSIQEVLNTSAYINGPLVHEFQADLEKYLDVKHVIPCANGTDALQIAMMGLGLEQGDEVITVDFTFAATVEVIALLKLTPVLVDVEKDTFNIDIDALKRAITPKTKAIVPVHLFGQSSEMEPIVAKPFTPENTVVVREAPNVALDKSYIGSCTGAKYEDLEAAAKIEMDKQRKHKECKVKWSKIWKSCTPNETHEYLEFKGTKAFGTRVDKNGGHICTWKCLKGFHKVCNSCNTCKHPDDECIFHRRNSCWSVDWCRGFSCSESCISCIHHDWCDWGSCCCREFCTCWKILGGG